MEKTAKRKLALELDYGVQGEQAERIAQKWRILSDEIRRQTNEFVALAQTQVEKTEEESNHSGAVQQRKVKDSLFERFRAHFEL